MKQMRRRMAILLSAVMAVSGGSLQTASVMAADVEVQEEFISEEAGAVYAGENDDEIDSFDGDEDWDEESEEDEDEEEVWIEDGEEEESQEIEEDNSKLHIINTDGNVRISENNGDILMERGKPVTLAVKADLIDGPVTYQWYIADAFGGESEIAGATGSTYTIPSVSTQAVYFCRAFDSKYSAEVNITVSLYDGLHTDDAYDGRAKVGESKTLTMNGISSYGKITYKWYLWNDSSDYKYLGEGNSYTIDKVEEEGVYLCVYTDGRDTQWAFYHIFLADGKLVVDIPSRNEITFKKGQEITLRMKAHTSEDREVEYHWYHRGVYIEDDADTDTFIVKSPENEDYYECVVTDGVNEEHAMFWLYEENKCDHKSATWKTTKAATCGAPGEKVKVCKDCNTELGREAIPATGKHTFGEFKVTREATALQTGEKVKTCSVCGKEEKETIAKLVSKPKFTVKSVSTTITKKPTTLKVKGLAKGDSVASMTSDKPQLVTVTNDGKLTVVANKTGSAKITAKLASGKTTTIKVTVKKVTIKTTKISGLKSSLTLKVGKSKTLKPVLTPANSTEKVTYKSSNTKVATVSSKGVIKAKKAGKAVITVKSGKKTKKVTVTVKKK